MQGRSPMTSAASDGHRSLSADYLKRSQRIFSTHQIDDDGLIEPQEDHQQQKILHLSRGPIPHWSRSNSSHQTHRETYESSLESQQQRLRTKPRLELSPHPRHMAAADRSRKIEQTNPTNQRSVPETEISSNQMTSQQNSTGAINLRPRSRPAAPNLNAASLLSQSIPKGETLSAPLMNQSSPSSPRTLKLSLRQNRSSPTQPSSSKELFHLQLPPNNNGSLSDSIISPVDHIRSPPLPSSPSSTSNPRRPQLSDNGHTAGKNFSSTEFQRKRVEDEDIGKRLTVEQLLHSQSDLGDSVDSNEVDLPAVNLLVEKFYRSLQSRANGRFESFKRRLESVCSDRS